MMKLDRRKLRILLLDSYQTQRDLSAKSGVSRGTVNNICRGCACSDETAAKIADSLGVPVEDLLEHPNTTP